MGTVREDFTRDYHRRTSIRIDSTARTAIPILLSKNNNVQFELALLLRRTSTVDIVEHSSIRCATLYKGL